VAAACIPLAPDEAYYWVWSKALAAGYPDHPPMVALWIRAGTALGGETLLGVRLLAPLAAAAGSVLLWRAAEDLLPGRAAGLTAVVLANATLLFGVGAVLMTPDTPLLFFWTLALFGCGRVLATGRAAWWAVAGLAGGLAMASKYTAALLAPAVLVWLLAVPSLRGWLRRPGPWLAALLGLAVFAPVLAWNADSSWVSFIRQGGRVADWHPARAAQFVAELLGGQIGLATPLLAMMFGAGSVMAVRRAWARDPAWTLLAALLGVPALVFLQHALGDRVQANWPSILYPQAAIAAAGLGGAWRRLRTAAAGLGWLVTLLVWVQAASAPLALPARFDPTLARLGGWQAMADEVARSARAEGVRAVAADNYGTAAELAWHLPPDFAVLALGDRWQWFDLPAATAFARGGQALLVASDRAPDTGEATALGTLDRGRNGQVAAHYRLWRVLGRPGPEAAVVLPSRRGAASRSARPGARLRATAPPWTRQGP
jgi:4-amino-4-deoxy-L-arabinose transferase-like glycosyltransferase